MNRCSGRELNGNAGAMRRRIHHVLAGLTAGVLCLSWTFAQVRLELCGYKAVVIGDAQGGDPQGLGGTLRNAARDVGFRVFADPGEVPEGEQPYTLLASWNWTEGIGLVVVDLADLLTGKPVHRVKGEAISLSAARSRRAAAERAWKQCQCGGYSDDAHARNIAALFPPRPKVLLDETEFRRRSPGSRIEGIWSEIESRFSIAIFASDPPGKLIGAMLKGVDSIWTPGEIKIELTPTAAESLFLADYYMFNKERARAIARLDDDSLLLDMTLPNGEKRSVLLVKTWPIENRSTSGVHTAPPSTGSGFVVSEDGLLVTNWQVVVDATEIYASFPVTSTKVLATILKKDVANDLAVLKLSDWDGSRAGCPKVPYRLRRSNTVRLGEAVFTVGYPLESILGKSPKTSSGVISSQSGLDDDPRCFQHSAPIQPGSSGSPLLDTNGNVIGVVVSSINAEYLYAKTGVLPQAVNFAIKMEYVLNLLDMLGVIGSAGESKSLTADEVSPCVALIDVKRERAESRARGDD